MVDWRPVAWWLVVDRRLGEFLLAERWQKMVLKLVYVKKWCEGRQPAEVSKRDRPRDASESYFTVSHALALHKTPSHCIWQTLKCCLLSPTVNESVHNA
jgi:hypothetical protein